MAGPGLGGPIPDHGLALRYGKRIITHKQFHTLLLEGTPNLEAALGAGTPAIIETSGITASELAGFRMDAADEIYTLLGLGDLDIDLTRDIQARVVYGLQEAAKSGLIWGVTIKGLSETVEQVISDGKVSADGTIATAASPANTNAGALMYSEWKAFNIANTLVGDGYAILAVTLNSLGNATADNVFFQALELRYTRSICAAGEVREAT